MDPVFTAGLELMIIGMGTVFVFLTVLVAATKIMSVIVQRFAPLPVTLLPQTSADSSTPSAEEVAAITAALHQHRTIRNSKTQGS
jgi:oxaloacetate decarboxylase (Na+ extruding) subunit gamma